MTPAGQAGGQGGSSDFVSIRCVRVTQRSLGEQRRALPFRGSVMRDQQPQSTAVVRQLPSPGPWAFAC